MAHKYNKIQMQIDVSDMTVGKPTICRSPHLSCILLHKSCPQQRLLLADFQWCQGDCAKNSTYSLPCPLSPFSVHFTWFSSKKGALTSSHQEYQTSPQLWWNFWWEREKEKCMHQLCGHVLGVSGYILRLWCLKAKPILISVSMQAQKSTFCLFFSLGTSTAFGPGPWKKSMNFVIDIELYHVCHHHHFCV